MWRIASQRSEDPARKIAEASDLTVRGLFRFRFPLCFGIGPQDLAPLGGRIDHRRHSIPAASSLRSRPRRQQSRKALLTYDG